MIRVQDKGSRIVFEDKERYINNVLSYLENTNITLKTNMNMQIIIGQAYADIAIAHIMRLLM